MMSPAFWNATQDVPRIQWYNIVEAYAWRTLTFRKDRLPAIAAMATLAKRHRTDDRYIAGLWRSSLCFDLFWYTDTSDGFENQSVAITRRIRSFSEPDTHRLPSWSWASTSNPVRWNPKFTHKVLSCVEVLNIAYKMNGPDVLGDIQSAAITVRAPLYDFGDLHRDYLEHTFGPQSHFDGTDMPCSIYSTGTRAFCYNCMYLDDVGFVPLYELNKFAPTIFHGLFILHLLVKTASNIDQAHQALILKPTNGLDQFFRVGIIEFDLLSHKLDMDAWHNANGDRGKTEYPPERSKAYRDELISILETAETQVITLI
jgi:hypothetical protein